MSEKRIRLGFGAGIVSLIVDGMAGIGLIHLLFKNLSSQEAGFWSLLTTAGAFFLLLPSALSPAISRTIAQSNWNELKTTTQVVPSQIQYTVRLQQIALLALSMLVFFIYILPILNTNGLTQGGAVAWTLYVFGLLITFEAFGHIACLNGFGEVGWDKLIRIGTTTIGFLANWWLLSAGIGLVGLSLVYVLQSAGLLLLAKHLCKQRTYKTFQWIGDLVSAKPLIFEASRILFLAGAGYVVSNSGVLVVEKQFGLENVARINAIIRVGTMLASVCILYPQMTYPYVAQAWSRQDKKRVRQLYNNGIIIAVSLCVLGSIVIGIAAKWVFPLWLGSENYLGPKVLFWTLAYQFVYVHHVAHSTPVLAATGDTFALPALLNALLVPLCLFWSPNTFGIVGVPIGMLVGTLVPSIWVVVRCWRTFNPKQNG
jgi:O-antigen/teichoic acid export membrane protein